MAIDRILSSGLGVQGTLPDAGVRQEHLPEAARFVAGSVEQKAGLDSLYGANQQQRMLQQALSPRIDNPQQLAPAVLSRNLATMTRKLSRIKDRDIRSFVRKDLEPLEQNRELLNAYLGMMVTG